MTPQEYRCVNAIRSYQESHGYSPTYDEIGEAIGLRSKSGISRLLVSLQAQRVLTWRPSCARSIELCGELVTPPRLNAAPSAALRSLLAHVVGILAARDGGWETKVMLDGVGEALLRPGERAA